MDYFEKYRYPIVGGLVGALVAICIFTIGFWKMILLLILVALGIFVGLFLKSTGIIEQFKKRH
ncbi:DUF2273 domain-containing protein [Lactococcus kimchii]|uniref:DUF2273 domain-containing protein n=1 Tax=Lactococcus sp. S-13 TaxID=2507158 RepID=UPI001022B89C|nr:DUF2273 domain-containing protein [Lactococcus sp. S-13]RZI48038.1 DUF2273 domain-containing protein [Lactococcus sp. S-13]